MRVLVTGAAGFLGQRVVSLLSSSGFDVIPMVRIPGRYKHEVVADFESAEFSGIVESLPSVDALVHLGAHIDFKERAGPGLIRPNVIATALLANWAARNQAYILFASSAVVAGKNCAHIHDGSPANPDTDYAKSKWIAEEIIKMSGTEYAILRIGGIYGADGPDFLGINKSIREAFKGQTPALYGDGKGKRNYIFVKDLAEIIKKCLEEKILGIHCAAGPDILSMEEMLTSICLELAPGQSLTRLPGTEGFDQIVDRFEGFEGGVSFRDALRDIRNEKTTA